VLVFPHNFKIWLLPENVFTAGEIFHDFFVSVQEHFIAYCRCREAVKLFRFLLSPYSLIGTCTSLQNCTFRDCTGTFYSLL
jgi:hypothetical protein